MISFGTASADNVVPEIVTSQARYVNRDEQDQGFHRQACGRSAPDLAGCGSRDDRPIHPSMDDRGFVAAGLIRGQHVHDVHQKAVQLLAMPPRLFAPVIPFETTENR